jgi:hypothetical protein
MHQSSVLQGLSQMSQTSSASVLPPLRLKQRLRDATKKKSLMDNAGFNASFSRGTPRCLRDELSPGGKTIEMLRRELRRLREAKGKNAKGIKNPMAKDFGGGKVENLPEELNSLSESDELDEEADEVAEKAIKVAKKATDAAKQERAARVEEARMNRHLKAKLVEAAKEAVTLREQLEEVNLFNAKLLYVNKLMQNRDLTPRQQRSIVESLDAAKSVREAKLLYTSLTESLKSKSGTMTEGRILGSSSRSTRPGGTASLNESVEVDRWAILAGIKSGK